MARGAWSVVLVPHVTDLGGAAVEEGEDVEVLAEIEEVEEVERKR
jgi:hypothetical protein